MFNTLIKILKQLIFKMRFYTLSGESRIKFLRTYGLSIGRLCQVHTTDFSSEPFLIEIGNHVVISSGVKFITHDGSCWVVEHKFPDLDVFGPIRIGDNTFIGMYTIIMPNTTIGSNCVIGAGSVVRGTIPDNSVALGNPAKVIMKTSMLNLKFSDPRYCLNTKHMKYGLKMKTIKDHFRR
jgi:acetyltransferase-like isoleucine patch superfamily enzyme